MRAMPTVLVFVQSHFLLQQEIESNKQKQSESFISFRSSHAFARSQLECWNLIFQIFEQAGGKGHKPF